MTNNQFITSIVNIIKRDAGLQESDVLIMDTPLSDLGFDSMSRHSLALALETEFSLDIEVETADAWTTAQDVVDTLTNLKPGDYVTLSGDDRTFKVLPSHDVKGDDFTYDTWDKDAVRKDTETAMRGMPVINRITREDVDLFRSNVTFWPEDKANGATSDLDFYQTIATKSAIYPGQGTPLGLIYVALKTNGEAGEFAEHVGKAMRDDSWIDRDMAGDYYNSLTADRRAAIVKEMGDILWYLSAAANELGTTLSAIALANLEKLCDRTERDALRGSGDER